MFHADLHIHSRFSRACSKDCDIEHLSAGALRKGLRVLGTGDFTHPAWSAELRETLVPAEPGLFRVRPELEKRLLRDSLATCSGTVRFMLSVDKEWMGANLHPCSSASWGCPASGWVAPCVPAGGSPHLAAGGAASVSWEGLAAN